MKKILVLSVVLLCTFFLANEAQCQQWWPTTSPAVYNPYTGTWTRQYRLGWVPQTTTTVITPAPACGFRWLRYPRTTTTTTYNIQPIPWGNYRSPAITYGPNGGVNIYNYNY